MQTHTSVLCDSNSGIRKARRRGNFFSRIVQLLWHDLDPARSKETSQKKDETLCNKRRGLQISALSFSVVGHSQNFENQNFLEARSPCRRNRLAFLTLTCSTLNVKVAFGFMTRDRSWAAPRNVSRKIVPRSFIPSCRRCCHYQK